MILTYINLALIAFFGMFIMLLSKSQDMEATSKKANLIYEGFVAFIKRDWKAVTVNVITIIVTGQIFGPVVSAADSFFQDKTYTLYGYEIPIIYLWTVFIGVFAFATGYFGQDFILRKLVKSVQNKLIKEAIDYKTSIADKETGTLDKPTPIQ